MCHPVNTKNYRNGKKHLECSASFKVAQVVVSDMDNTSLLQVSLALMLSATDLMFSFVPRKKWGRRQIGWIEEVFQGFKGIDGNFQFFYPVE